MRIVVTRTLVLLVVLLAGGCSLPCANSEIAEYPSPNGRLKVVVFTRDCGATTSLSTHVSIVRSWWPNPRRGGNVLVTDYAPIAVFHLRHFEESSLAEIAEILGLSVGTVKTHLSRAGARVRQRLREDES